MGRVSSAENSHRCQSSAAMRTFLVAFFILVILQLVFCSPTGYRGRKGRQEEAAPYPEEEGEKAESTTPIWCNPHRAAPWRSRVRVDLKCKELAAAAAEDE